MRNRVIIVGVILALAAFVLPSAALATTAILSVSSPVTVPQGNTFAVDVNISNASDLYDYQFDLAFNPAVLSFTGTMTEGSFLSGGGATFFIPGADNGTGAIQNNADTLLTAISGVSGQGTLIEFIFTALAPGTSSLSIQNVLLQDSLGNSITDFSTTAGSVTVTGTAPVSEPSSAALFLAGALGILVLAFKRA